MNQRRDDLVVDLGDGRSMLADPNAGVVGGVRAVQMTEVSNFSTFSAEYTTRGEDILVHFFKTEEVAALPNSNVYWSQTFPNQLSEVAQRHFEVSRPRLTASYTQELESWFLLAKGFAHLDVDAYLLLFFRSLDAALDAHVPTRN